MKNDRSSRQFHADDLPIIMRIWGAALGLMALLTITIFYVAG